MTPNECKRMLSAFVEKQKWASVRFTVSKYEPDTVRCPNWPSMQGQGVEAAGWMAVNWNKLVKLTEKHGYRLRRWRE